MTSFNILTLLALKCYKLKYFDTMNKKELTINIEGMSCGHCTNSVYQKISSIEGVMQTDVSLADKNAKVEYDSDKTSREDIVEAVMETPFQVVGVA